MNKIPCGVVSFSASNISSIPTRLWEDSEAEDDASGSEVLLDPISTVLLDPEAPAFEVVFFLGSTLDSW